MGVPFSRSVLVDADADTGEDRDETEATGDGRDDDAGRRLNPRHVVVRSVVVFHAVDAEPRP